MRAFIIILLSVFLASCANLKNDSISVITSSASDGAKLSSPIILREPYSLNTKLAIGKITMTLAAGTYLPIGENEQGAFYIGPKDCLLTEGSFMMAFTAHCGLYIKNNNNEIIYFFHFDSGYQTSNKAFWNASELQKYKSNNFDIETEHPISVKNLNVIGLD